MPSKIELAMDWWNNLSWTEKVNLMEGDFKYRHSQSLTGSEIEKLYIMEQGFISVKERLPEKGEDIIAIDKDGNKHYCFRCACNNPNCKEWRCSLTGYGLIIDVEKWTYEQF